ncbi:ATP-dependent DNA helicase RecQ [Dokdonia sp. Hel_I_53]|uniref:RecQ family ATP-dependent DNA helicase n=1 Tax=Dokdonia sp. Hel_I_53 TaxID=1566287 RepID=UPI00119A7DC8|nr:ATP-dependent DNA helicase RecQ [Dokdonia sp. Hel_I_53]TVZ51808.1 ATP-dependent DNA helicase RecQ [Dokdonia sp. Hel_I_53]
MTTTSKEILKKYWGYDNFKPKQQEIIKAIISRKDTIALLPTGGGKSICYQLPALLFDGITIVISPLIALMKDQVLSLQEKGIKSLAIPSGIKHSELDTLLDNCIYGNYKLLYLSPERLQQELVQERIKRMNVSLIAIDEAHCISQWGHDFRPAYRDISKIRNLEFQHKKTNPPIIALTATATPRVIEDITEQLRLDEPKLFQTSYHRANLTYTVQKATDKFYQLEDILNKSKSSCIVYVRNRKATVNTAHFLNSRGITSTYYHGGMSRDDRHKQYLKWRSNHTKVMVGTSAFGMGIDKADVDCVVHMEIPDSIENYFQESGRAGRAGQKATAMLIYNENDLVRLDNQFIKVIPGVQDVKKIYKHLSNYFQISYGEGQQTNHRFNFSEFCSTYKLHSILAYNALQVLDRNSIISLSQEFTKRATVNFKVNEYALSYYLLRNNQLDDVVKAILRTYGAVFEQVTTINYAIISTKASRTVDQVHTALLTLHRDDIIDYEHQSFDTSITFLVPRDDDRTINTIAPFIKNQANFKRLQVDSIKAFINNSNVCRAIQLMSYFNETMQSPCGLCDVCKDKTVQKNRTPANQAIIDILYEGPKSAHELTSLTHPKADIIHAIRLLLDQKKIVLQADNTYKLL